jgi:hypothetical protein
MFIVTQEGREKKEVLRIRLWLQIPPAVNFGTGFESGSTDLTKK